jgi:hypothetical protein
LSTHGAPEGILLHAIRGANVAREFLEFGHDGALIARFFWQPVSAPVFAPREQAVFGRDASNPSHIPESFDLTFPDCVGTIANGHSVNDIMVPDGTAHSPPGVPQTFLGSRGDIDWGHAIIDLNGELVG